MRYAIVYVSNAAGELNELEVQQLLAGSKRDNNKKDVTGILLYSESNFFQVLEGEKKTVLDLYDTIQQDKRHNNLIQIFGKEINNESFDGYESDFISENTEIDQEKMQHYIDYIKVLDKPTQKAVENILRAFIPA